MRLRLLLACLTAAALLSGAADAVMVADPPGRRLDPPPVAEFGPERGGWEYAGAWGRFVGVAVSRRHFLTARHVGGHIGGWFRYRGRDYRAVGRTAVPGADMTLWQVETDLPAWAPLFRGDQEVGERCVVVGRGLAPGQPVLRDGRPVGWIWGESDGRFSWGTAPIVRASRGDQGESLLVGAFTRDGCGLATGDSGGGVFVRQDGRWALAGICRSVERDWSDSPDGRAPWPAALYDARGFHRLSHGVWDRVDGAKAEPSFWFASRVADQQTFLRAVLDGPPGPNWFRIQIGAALAVFLVVLAAGARMLTRARRRQSSAKTSLRRDS